MSVNRTSAAIKQVVANGKFKFDQSKYFPLEQSPESFEFEFKLRQLIQVCSPIAKALTCLEANNVNLADVWVYWHAVIFSIEKVLANKFPLDAKNKILSVLNHRHKQLFEPNGRLYNPAYLVAAFLNPAYLNSDLFRDADINSEQPLSADIIQKLESASICHPRTFYGILAYLLELGSNEVEYGGLDFFTKWRGRASAFKETLKNELLTYAQGRFPFNLPFERGASTTLVIQWWKSCICENIYILPYLAVKLYSIRINSMEEERTGSTFTWMTPAVRNRLSVEMKGSKTQIHRYYQTQEACESGKKTEQKKQKKFTNVKNSFYRMSKSSCEQVSREMEEAELDDSWLDENAEVIPSNPTSLLSAAKFVDPEAYKLVSLLSETDPSHTPKLTGAASAASIPTTASAEAVDTNYSIDDMTF
ncbi:hypothetical protein D9758_018990 [Tetrapyrgos nigripes]|uniref:Uncharacterized protein n=1 Tax=Tetrapyrgos nigripes TaxID=182062 RepID=A0A8H5ERH9_9AGAR|nr:hypothetical protein D9758_018990 [Tetrapyrgos nigripes]